MNYSFGGTIACIALQRSNRTWPADVIQWVANKNQIKRRSYSMKRNIALGVFALVASSLLAADSDPKAEVKGAIKKLAGSGGYSWKTTPSAPRGGGGGGGGGRFRPGPTEGQAAKDGVTHLSMTRGENTIEAYLKERKGALKTEDGWKSLEEASQSDGQPNPTTFLARMLGN